MFRLVKIATRFKEATDAPDRIVRFKLFFVCNKRAFDALQLCIRDTMGSPCVEIYRAPRRRILSVDRVTQIGTQIRTRSLGKRVTNRRRRIASDCQVFKGFDDF